MLKRQIQTLELPAVRMDRVRLERTITHRSYSLYYQGRRKIEEDLRLKEKKRLGLSLDAPPPAETQGEEPATPPPGEPVTETQGELSRLVLQLPEQDAPPPASLATRTDEGTPLKREPQAEETPLEEPKFNEEAEKVRQEETAALKAVTNRPVPTNKEALPKDEAAAAQIANPPGAELLYQSNFYSSSDDWFQGEKEGIKRFCQEGYYHIFLVEPYWWANSTLDNINLTDFRVYAEAEIIMHTGNNARCGIVFRRTNTDNEYSFYYFSISRSGYYNIGFRNNKYWRDILADRYSEFINQGDRVNSLMVEAIGQKITVGVNGHILETIMDNSLSFGSIGFSMQTGLDSTAEARFRNLRLYSLEQ